MPSSGEQTFEMGNRVSVGGSLVAGSVAVGEGALVAVAGAGGLARAGSSGDGAAVGAAAGVGSGGQAARHNNMMIGSNLQATMLGFIFTSSAYSFSSKRILYRL